MGASKDAAFHASLDFLTPTLSHLLTKRDMPATLFKRRHAEKMFTQENLKFPHFSPERVSRHFFHTLIQFEVVLSASAYTFYNNTVARFRSLFSLKFSIYSEENSETKAVHFLRAFKMRAEHFFSHLYLF